MCTGLLCKRRTKRLIPASEKIVLKYHQRKISWGSKKNGRKKTKVKIGMVKKTGFSDLVFFQEEVTRMLNLVG